MQSPTKQTPLSRLGDILKKDDFVVHLNEKGPEIPFEQLFVSLGEDAQDRPFILQMLFVNDLAGIMKLEEKAEDATLLQHFLIFPFIANAMTVPELSKLILMLNRIIPLGAFGLDVNRGTPYYQYILAAPDREINQTVALEAVSMIGMFTMEFASKLEAVASGEKKAQDVIKELEEIGLFIPPLAPMPNLKETVAKEPESPNAT